MEKTILIQQYDTALQTFFSTPPESTEFPGRLQSVMTLAATLAEQGHVPAQSWLGQTVYEGLYNITPDQTRGLGLLQDAAKGGDVFAAFTLATIYSADNYRKYKACAELLVPLIDTYPPAKAKLGQMLLIEHITPDIYSHSK